LNYFRCGHIDIFKIIHSTIYRKKGNLIRKRDVALLGKLPVILFFIDTFRKHTTTVYWIVYTMTQLEAFKEHNVFSNIQTVNGFNLNLSILLKYLSKYAHCMMIEPTRNHSRKYHNSFFKFSFWISLENLFIDNCFYFLHVFVGTYSRTLLCLVIDRYFIILCVVNDVLFDKICLKFKLSFFPLFIYWLFF